MNNKTTADEQPKRKVAKKVITDKRRYFVPAHNVSVDAADATEAVEIAEQVAKEQEDGDAE